MTRTILTSATILLIAASAASAKGHSQGNTAIPGADDVGSVTVASAHTLGSAKGNRPEGKGPKANNPAPKNAGR